MTDLHCAAVTLQIHHVGSFHHLFYAVRVAEQIHGRLTVKQDDVSEIYHVL